MAHRKHKKYKRVPSDEVQGEGSFVLLRSPGFSDLQGLGDLSNLGEDEGQAIHAVVPMLARLVADWDWVDDEDNPLPKPSEQPEVIDGLTFQEQKFLVDALDLGGLTDQKN
jgi:hypothetical protein